MGHTKKKKLKIIMLSYLKETTHFSKHTLKYRRNTDNRVNLYIRIHKM